MQISHIDHLVLTVIDVDTTCRFYSEVLGMQVVTFGNNRKALQFGTQKINLHQAGREFDPKAALSTPGSADICFIVELNLEDVIKHLRDQQVEIIEGPVQRTGACGAIQSVYIRDPDANLIELATYIN